MGPDLFGQEILPIAKGDGVKSVFKDRESKESKGKQGGSRQQTTNQSKKYVYIKEEGVETIIQPS